MDMLRRNVTSSRLDAASFNLFRCLPSPCLIISPTYKVLAANDEYLALPGIDSTNLVGTTLQKRHHRGDNSQWIGNPRVLIGSIRQALKTRKRTKLVLRTSHPYTQETASSVKRRWRATNTPIYDESGDLVYLLHELKKLKPTNVIRRFAKRLIAMQEEDRARIARELHDQMAQHIAAMTLGLEHLKTQNKPRDFQEGIDHIQTLVGHVGEDIHRLAWNLRPAPIDELGFRESLVVCVEDLSVQSSIDIHFHSNLHEKERFDSCVENVCYRIIQEALANVVKHAHAQSACVVVTRSPSQLKIIVEDNGVGFKPSSRKYDSACREHLGLQGMRERMALIGGHLQIESSSENGTSLFASIPLSLQDRS